MRTAAYKVDVAMRPPQARVSQAKLYFTKLQKGTGLSAFWYTTKVN